MVVTWFGLSSFNISSGKFTLVTDPFSKSIGLTPPRVQTDVAVISNATKPEYNNQDSLGGDETFTIDGPGEFDVKGLFIRGIAASGSAVKKDDFDHTTIYAISMEDIMIGFLGSINQKELSDEQLESLGKIDVLFVPVGNKDIVSDAESAVRMVNQIEPEIVIPMHYAQKGLKLKLDDVQTFLKEFGSKPKPEDRLTIKKSDFNGGQTKVVVLEPQRS